MNLAGSRWVFKTNLKLDGSVESFKDRFIAKVYNELFFIDCIDLSVPSLKLLKSGCVVDCNYPTLGD